MNLFFTFTLALLIPAAPAFAGDNSLLSEMYRFTDLFDGGRADIVEVSPPSTMPIPKGNDGSANQWWKQIPGLPTNPQGSEWDAPSIQGIPVESPNKHRDILKEMHQCSSVDYLYARQPSTSEVVIALSDCLTSLSKRYKVKITAAEGKKGIVLMLSGLTPPGSTVKADLEMALQIRNGKLFGHPVSLVDLVRPASDRQTSSLQPIVDQCDIETKTLKNAAAFVSVFSQCVQTAKGIKITSIRPDSKDETLVLVYSRDARHLIREMNGVVRILTDEGVTRLRVHAQSELLTDPMINGGLGLPVALPQ